MKLISKIAALAIAIPMAVGCSDFLEIEDESAVNGNIWNSYTTASLYLNSIYKGSVPEFGGDYVYGTTRATACSDEVITTNDLLLGTMTAGSVGTYSATNYQMIRYINIAFGELKNSSMSETNKNMILGQLYFFRAWQHWRMVLAHGGVPYMTEVVDYVSDDAITNAPRNKTSECIKYITDDMTQAMELLPGTWEGGESDYGRVTSATAAAMLGRILMFYASPQFTPDQTSAEAATRWNNAYEANKKAIEVCQNNGYGLIDCSTSVTTLWPTVSDINKVFYSHNTEVLFTRCYSLTKTHSYENSVRPGDMTNSSSIPSNCPSLNLVMAFPNADGTVYRGTNTDLYYWKDRDPRFYSTIAYNSCYYPSKANAKRRQWIYTGGDAADKTSETGYYCRKMVNPDTEEYGKTTTDWVEMRYAEVLLNYAEAAAMTNHEDEAYNALGQLRARAGIAEGDSFYGLKAECDNDYSLLEKVMNERRIELAFEGKRFWDLRRRNMFTEDISANTTKLYGQKKAGWVVTYSLKTGTTAAAFEAIRDNLTSEEVAEYMAAKKKSAPITAKAIKYICCPDYDALSATTDGNYNFFDIPSGILTRSPAVKQTLGWTEGEFNPFE